MNRFIIPRHLFVFTLFFIFGCGTTKTVNNEVKSEPVLTSTKEEPKVRVPFVINPIIKNTKWLNQIEKVLKTCKVHEFRALTKELTGLEKMKELLETESNKFENAEILSKAECFQAYSIRLQLKKDSFLLHNLQAMMNLINNQQNAEEELRDSCANAIENVKQNSISFNNMTQEECGKWGNAD